MYMGDLHISKNKCVAQHVIKDGPVCKAAEMIRSETILTVNFIVSFDEIHNWLIQTIS